MPDEMTIAPDALLPPEIDPQRILTGNPYNARNGRKPTAKPRPRAKANGGRVTQKRAEADFQKQVSELARTLGWDQQFHVVDQGLNRQTIATAQRLREQGEEAAAAGIMRAGHSRVTAPGFPDLALSHPEKGVLFAELKSDRTNAKPTPEQWLWLLRLRDSLRPPDNAYAPGRVHLWRPRDWDAVITQLGNPLDPQACICPVCRDETPPLAPAKADKRKNAARQRPKTGKTQPLPIRQTLRPG